MLFVVRGSIHSQLAAPSERLVASGLVSGLWSGVVWCMDQPIYMNV